MSQVTLKILTAVFVIAGLISSASGQDTVFSHNFGTYFEDADLLTLEDLSAEGDLVGEWSGDDFKDGDPTSHWSILVGCDGEVDGDCPSAGIVANPWDEDASFLYIDRPEAPATHFMNLTDEIETAGAQFSVTLGTRRTGGGFPREPKSYDFFGLDGEGNESFRIRVLADGSQERLGYVADGQQFNDIPGTDLDMPDDIQNTGGPAFGENDDIVELTLKLGAGTYQVEYNNLNGSNAWTSGAIPFNGSGTKLAQVGLSYGGVVGVNNDQVGFFVGNLSVSGFEDLLLGDFDSDNDVDLGDFLTLSANFGNSVDPGTDGDFDFNGTVDLNDWVGFKAAFNQQAAAGAQPVPEPSSLGILALAFIGSLTLRRRR